MFEVRVRVRVSVSVSVRVRARVAIQVRVRCQGRGMTAHRAHITGICDGLQVRVSFEVKARV